jgi:hypothetical protein
MIRPLRWYEQALVRLLSRSPRIDQILIVQVPGANAAERRQNTAALQLEMAANHFERLYQGPTADR